VAFLIGFLVAVVGSSAYLFFGSWGWIEVGSPSWARIVLCPGMIAGLATYEVLESVVSHEGLLFCISAIVGVLTMGIVGGVTAILASWGVEMALARITRQEDSPDPGSES